MEKFYTIGEIANLLGVSRDTLRFYEKKGLITAFKGENGYRYYSSENIWTLLDILFYRKINYSLEEIDSIINHSTYQSVTAMTQDKMKEEIQQIEMHRMSLIKLRIANESYQRIDKHLNRFSLRPFSKCFVVSKQIGETRKGRDDWFKSMQDRKGFEFCYIHEEFKFQKDSISRGSIYLMIAAKTAKALRIEDELTLMNFVEFSQCVYTVVESKSRTPDIQSIEKAMAWSDSKGLNLKGIAYSDYLLSCAQHGITTFYLELYLPVHC